MAFKRRKEVVRVLYVLIEAVNGHFLNLHPHMWTISETFFSSSIARQFGSLSQSQGSGACLITDCGYDLSLKSINRLTLTRQTD